MPAFVGRHVSSDLMEGMFDQCLTWAFKVIENRKENSYDFNTFQFNSYTYNSFTLSIYEKMCSLKNVFFLHKYWIEFSLLKLQIENRSVKIHFFKFMSILTKKTFILFLQLTLKLTFKLGWSLLQLCGNVTLYTPCFLNMSVPVCEVEFKSNSSIRTNLINWLVDW